MKGLSNNNLTTAIIAGAALMITGKLCDTFIQSQKISAKENRNARNLQFERETGKAPESTNTSSSGTEGLDDEDEDDDEE